MILGMQLKYEVIVIQFKKPLQLLGVERNG